MFRIKLPGRFLRDIRIRRYNLKGRALPSHANIPTFSGRRKSGGRDARLGGPTSRAVCSPSYVSMTQWGDGLLAAGPRSRQGASFVVIVLALCLAGGFVGMRGGYSSASAATPTPAASQAAPSASPGASPTPISSPTPIAATIDKDGFRPLTIRVYAGQFVTWTNADKKPHTATAADGSWDTGQIDPGQSQTLQFFDVGKIDYLDGFNPTVHATLIVLPGPPPIGAQ
jgi:plastocyanin